MRPAEFPPERSASELVENREENNATTNPEQIPEEVQEHVMPKKPKSSRPRITPQIEQDIVKRLNAGRTPVQIHEVLKGSGEASSVASLATIYRIKELNDVAQEATQRAERRMWLTKISGLLAKGTSMNMTEIHELLFKATGEKL